MLRKIEEMFGFTVRGRDEDVGRIHDFYFDSQNWTIRYIVVETGPWLFGERVLLAPRALQRLEWDEERVSVALTQRQIEEAPNADLAQPVSEQQLREMHTYYGWPWWGGALLQSGPAYLPMPFPAPALAKEEGGEEQRDRPYLRSSREVIGYRIHALDGDIGHTTDLLATPADWIIRYLLVDTRRWLPGREVIVSPMWVEDIRWLEGKIYVDLYKESVKNSPEYDFNQPISTAYEKRLHHHYNRTGYWTGTDV